jgi:hypothetical protein
LARFDLQSYAQLLSLDFKEQADLQEAKEGSSTLVAQRVLKVFDDFWIDEIGDKLVKLAVQLIVKHLTTIG